MRIRIEINEGADDDEIVIRCREFNKSIQKIQESILEISSQINLAYYKDQAEYFLPLDSILFFETSDKGIDAHTVDDFYNIKNKLYELENILPNNFVRVSKSTILNINHIYSIEKNITSTSVVRFMKTHKQVYVSRNYYKKLRERLKERRNYEA